MKLAKTRFRPAPRQLDLDIHFAVRPLGTPSPADFARWVSAALGSVRMAQLGLRVVDADEGQALNRDYRGKDYATNVLTFALNEGEEMIAGLPLFGDIVLCAPVLRREARAGGRTLRAHCAHLVVHGMLHLQGHDHATPREAARMEARETALLAALGFADPYAPRHPEPARRPAVRGPGGGKRRAGSS